MWVTDTAIRRPLTILMVILGLVVLGYQSMKRMPVDLYPKVDIPYVTVITVYRGAGAQEIETLISKPLEESVASVNKIKNVTASSQEGVSMVICEFQIGTDLDVAASDIRDKLDLAKSELPTEAEDPIIYKVDLNSTPIMYMGMSGKRSPAEIKKIADDIVKDRFGKVDGVASVSITGGETREIFVQVDQDRLKANGFNIMELTQAIAQANLNVPAGNVKQGAREYTVRVVGEFISPSELQGIKIKHQNPQIPGVVELKDIAKVLDTSAEKTDFTRLSGNDSVGIVIQKQADANTVKVADGVREELKNLVGSAKVQEEKATGLKKLLGGGKKKAEVSGVLPSDINITISRDNSKFIRDSLHDVTTHLFEGALLATLVVFLFLHIFRATFIVLLAIPTSIMATFLPISSFGFSLNVMTLMGLALCVGILVDDSIVVLENIFRHLALGEKPKEAALKGRMEIGGAAVAITLTDVVVFVPIAFMGGIVGQFFKQFGITIATATLFSLMVSFTLTPMLASRWLRTEDAAGHAGGGGAGAVDRKRGFWSRFFSKFDAFYDSLDNGYRGVLKWALRHRWFVFFGSFVILFVSLFAVFKLGLGFEFFPVSDNGQFDVTIEMPVGTNVAETDRITRQVENVLFDKKKYPEIDNVFTTVGEASGNFTGSGQTGPQYAQVMVKLVDKVGLIERLKYRFTGELPEGKRARSVWDVEDALQKDMAEIAGPVIRIKTTSAGGPGEAPIKIELSGDNTQEILNFASQVKKIVDGTPGTRDADISWKSGRPEFQVKIDRTKAAQYGLSVAAIAMTLRNSIEGDKESKYREMGKEYDIRIRIGENERRSIEDIENIMLAGAQTKNVMLKNVATVTAAAGPVKLERKNRQRMIYVEAYLGQGVTLGNITNEIKAKINELDKPVGVNVYFGGEATHMAESNSMIGGAMILAVLLVYMLMVALFESLLYPFIIMFSLPQALIGALWGLYLTNKSLSMVSMIGFIMLMGLVTKNAILLVDFTNTLRKRGMKRNDAIIEAGPIRLRPILMTTLTVILGNMPIALGLGSGSEMRAPMSIAVIGGLSLSLLLTLVVIPCTYTIMDDLTRFINRILGRKQSEFDEFEKPADQQPEATP